MIGNKRKSPASVVADQGVRVTNWRLVTMLNHIPTTLVSQTPEFWQEIPRSNGAYEASTIGRIRRKTSRTCGKSGHVLSMRPNRKGYLVTGLRLSGKSKTVTVHSLIALTFHGDRPDGMQINHIDGDKTNNRPENLEYCTQSQNMRHSYDVIGRKPTIISGERNHSAKLTSDDVREIRNLLREGVSQSEVARRYGVANPQINRIARGKGWTHVK